MTKTNDEGNPKGGTRHGAEKNSLDTEFDFMAAWVDLRRVLRRKVTFASNALSRSGASLPLSLMKKESVRSIITWPWVRLLNRSSRREEALTGPFMSVSASLLIATLFLGLALTTRAAVYSYPFSTGFANGGVIPDGNPTGWSDSRSVSGVSDFQITDVSVKLNISGGYNGDLYGYLSHNGVLVPLLNRVGVTATGGGNSFGYSDAGFNVTLSDSGSFDID